MKIEKFCIKNYKSIINSGDCYLTDNITILAWKNESGKSSILQALEDFDSDKNIRNEAIPISDTKLKPEIEITFIVPKDEITEIFKDWNITEQNELKEPKITIIKQFPNIYSLHQDSIDKLLLETEKKQKIWNLKINEIIKKYPDIFNSKNKTDLSAIIASIDVLLVKINSDEIASKNIEDKQKTIEHIMLQKQSISEIIALQDNTKVFLDSFVKWYMPYFIFYSSFNDRFPHKILKTELKDNMRAKDLQEISDFSIDTILGSDETQKKKHKSKINIELQWNFKKYWTQDSINLEIDWDTDSIFFWIQEDWEYYKPDQRSEWQQRHLAFYTKIWARAKEDVPNIILIDEPWLFLHAKAQKDLLLSLEDHSKDAQVIFSTHSPYLIETEKLNRIRLIFKDNKKKEWTKIYNKIHALSDKDTLTPILTAIWMDISDWIQDIWKKNNVIVEWQSDVFYLQAFKILNKIENINFVYWWWAWHVWNIWNILQRRWCAVIYLFDNDQWKKDWKKQLLEQWMVDEKDIWTIIDEEWKTIEDILSINDFKNYVLNEKDNDYVVANSGFVKNTRKDKVLLSRLFLQSVQNWKVKKLEKESEDNIKNLFKKIDDLFIGQ